MIPSLAQQAMSCGARSKAQNMVDITSRASRHGPLQAEILAYLVMHPEGKASRHIAEHLETITQRIDAACAGLIKQGDLERVHVEMQIENQPGLRKIWIYKMKGLTNG